MAATVRQATKEDEKIIADFLRIAYPGRDHYKYPERWRWEFLDNPYWEGDKLPVWIAVEDGKVVGQTCAMYSPLKVGGYSYKVAWSVDTIVLEQARGGGVGTALQRAQAQYHRIFMSLSMTEANRRIKIKFGSIPVDTAVVYTKRLRYRRDSVYNSVIRQLKKEGALKSAVKFILRTLFLDSLLAFCANILLAAKKPFAKRARQFPGVTIRKINDFKETGSLWERTKSFYGVIVDRDPKYLNWKYIEQPYMEYSSFIAEKDKEVKGYVVLRKARPPERRSGIIADLYAVPDDKEVLPALLGFAVSFFSDDRDYIEAATTVESFKRLYEELGFKKAKEAVPMFYCKEDIPGKDIILKKGSWFLSRADHDWDQYPLG